MTTLTRRNITLGGIAAVTAVVLAAGSAGVRHDNGLARTPPMGWNSWNHFGCNVSAQLIREVADAMTANGMREAGYQYVTIDDCWQVARDAKGVIVADSARFPGGMKPLADYVHAKGLKFGIYTDAGRRTSACGQSWRHRSSRGTTCAPCWIQLDRRPALATFS